MSIENWGKNPPGNVEEAKNDLIAIADKLFLKDKI